MFIFNGKKYAKNERELIDSLFTRGGTCNGYYKVLKRGVQLFRIVEGRKELEAFIAKRETGSFVVTAYMDKYSTKPKARYMFSTCDTTAFWLGLEGITYTDQRDRCQEAIESVYE